MKRKNLCMILLLSIGLTATACGAKESGTQGEQTVASTLAEPIEEAVGARESTPQEQPVPVEEKSYFGDWKITKCAGYAGVSALSEEEVNALIGITLNYQADSMYCSTWEGERLEITGYEEEPYQTAGFATDFKVNPENIGITAEEILSVTVLPEEGYLGQRFYAVDDNTLLLYHEGVFFLAERVN